MTAAAVFRAENDPKDKDERARRQEPAYVRAALQQFGIEAAAIDAILRRATSDPYIAAALVRILGDYSPGGAYHLQWLQRYTTLIETTVQVGAQGTSGTVGFDFNLTNPRVQAMIRQRAANLVQNVTETTKASITAAVELGRAQGLGVKEIAKLINETTFGEITKTRALTIARTETVGAMNAGEYESAVQSGVMRSKTWMTQGDSRVRPAGDKREDAPNHVKLDGVTIRIEDRFANGLLYPGEAGGAAGEVINCRCTLTFSDLEAP